MIKIAICIFALCALVAADSRETYAYRAPVRESSEESYESSESSESSEAKYNFEWNVSDESSDNHYGHQEARDGDDTQGSYYVQLPDGRLQKVTFHVDGDNGYVANVEYTGDASNPLRDVEAPRATRGRSFRPNCTPKECSQVHGRKK